MPDIVFSWSGTIQKRRVETKGENIQGSPVYQYIKYRTAFPVLSLHGRSVLLLSLIKLYQHSQTALLNWISCKKC